MKISTYLLTILLTVSLFQGCGSEEADASQITTQQSQDDIQIRKEVTTEAGLYASLQVLADNAQNAEEFSKEGTQLFVEYIVNVDLAYVPFVHGYFIEDHDWGDNSNQYFYEMIYTSSETLVRYMDNLYKSMISASNQVSTTISNAPLRASSLTTTTVENQSLIDEIINMIWEILKDMAASFSIFDDKQDAIIPDISQKYTVDPNQVFSFTMADIEDKLYYVASEQYMSVTFESDGLSGYGDIGYGVGASFKSYVSGEKLFIDMDGIYEVEMIYKDPGYCMVTEMTDTSDGSKYPAYWFVNEDTYDKATNVSTAKSLCYIHSSEYEAKVVATDGVLEPIQDSRVNHYPVSEASTSDMVSELVNGIDSTATLTDAKYFARKMRHGVFAIYTTNEQTHTLQATESEKISRELLPLAASSAIGMEEMLNGAYDSSIAFQDEVNRDLSAPVTDVNDRVDALIVATSQAMDRTTSQTNYRGVSDTTAYGDVVIFDTKIKSLSLFKNNAKADVTITVTNPNNLNGRTADITFITAVETTVIGDAPVEFDEIDATSTTSHLGGNDYNLNINSMKYTRANGLMVLKGDGYLGDSSKLLLDTYSVDATFQEEPTIDLLELKVTADGTITTTSGRNFDGVLVFDGYNTANSYMDGVLVGVNEEPKIDGIIRTSLSSQDITSWVSSHDDVSLNDAGDLEDIGDQSYSMDVNITKDSKSVSADMLVKRDNTADTWTYLMNNLSVSDENINLSASSIYLIQKGNNTLVDTVEKMALNGVGMDSDINTLVNVGWNIAKDFDNIGIEGLKITMKPSSGDVQVHSTIHMLNSGSTMSADMNTSYDYATTHLTSSGDFTTLVDSSSGENSYTNSFTTKGVIKVDNVFDYLYSIEYTDSLQDMLFTSNDSSYQMGFRLSNDKIIGGDSYGVLADFIMNDTYDILENMTLKNNDSELLGTYNRSEDKLQVNFSDGIKEYLYLY